MCTILLPIKPEYVAKIINGSKIYEYRKKQCKSTVKKIVIYSTNPIKKVIGEVNVIDILIDNPQIIWDKTKEYSGITYQKYKKYYQKSNIAVAYKLGRITLYKEPKKLTDLGINNYPQSYVYLKK